MEEIKITINSAENENDSVLGESDFRNEESLHLTTGTCPCDHQFSMNVADYQLGAVIGFGSSAIVYMAKYLPLLMDVAIKMIELDHFERNRIDELRKEIQVMAFCKHPNLLGNLTSFVHESKLWIVTPFLSGGSCLDILKSGFKDGFDEAVIATILFQALQGLEYLHENGHIHRDVKCGNLLMAEDGLVQLADFGVSSSLMEDGERHGMRKTYVGTPCWMAPEVMEITRGYDFKADIWSFGITALELAYGHAPYAKFPPMKVIYLTISGKPPTLDKKQAARKYSRMFKDMIDCCLQREPAKRPTAKMLLKHPFFKSMSRKAQFLVPSVLSHVPPVNLRDKSAQLRARGLPVPDEVTGFPEVNDAAGNNENEFGNRSFLSQVVTSDEYDNVDTSDSWDFSLDNSVEPVGPVPAPTSVFDVIAEEFDEEKTTSASVSENELVSENDKSTISDPLPEARTLEDSEVESKVELRPEAELRAEAELKAEEELRAKEELRAEEETRAEVETRAESEVENSFHDLQKNRTSRFILAAEEVIKDAIDRLDLSSTVVLSNDQPDSQEIVGSIGEIEVSLANSSNCTPPASTISSSSETVNFHVRSASPNEGNEPAPTEVKKGRFSVLEAVNTSDTDPIPENDLLESGAIIIGHMGPSPHLNPPTTTTNNNNSSNTTAIDEEKRSRFEVSLNIPLTEVSDSEPGGESVDEMVTNNMNHFQGNVDMNVNEHFEGNFGGNYQQYQQQQNHLQQQQNYQQQQQQPQQNINSMYNSTFYHHNSAPIISVPNYSAHSHSQTYVPTSSLYPPSLPPPPPPPPGHHQFYLPQPPLSPVNSVQLDHLLRANDYIRTQLVELKYRQELLAFHQQHQMRPHSTFNPHQYHNNNNNNNNNTISTSTDSHPHPQPHQLHHSHPIMPPPVDSVPSGGYPLEHQNCYCCPSHYCSSIAMTNSISPAPPESMTSSSSFAHNSNSNFAFILKELENIKKENEMLKAYLHQL